MIFNEKYYKLKKIILIILCLIIIYLTINHIYKNEYFSKYENIILDNFTIVICNYNRPWNFDKLLPHLLKYCPNSEIIVSHGDPKTYTEFKNVKNIKEFDNTYGATSRFFSDLNAKNDMILFLDDDILPSTELITKLLKYQKDNPISICGKNKRWCNKYGYYFKKNNNLDFNIILTPVLMTNKKIVKNFNLNFHKYKKFLKKYKGNGEDLSFNHNFITNYKKNPIYIEGDNILLDDTNGYSYKKNHLQVRNDFCKLYFK